MLVEASDYPDAAFADQIEEGVRKPRQKSAPELSLDHGTGKRVFGNQCNDEPE
jgi:hypothetical protein